ncbi:hypothetical protein [Alteromonas lipolytica]|uniref:Uncharacterized protein n=1 Tax=Alteromonas lipolytica TaxID=1856405 RepID=A0A1E8FBT8_9ALTE|nr:hypothetical protein [Alteromonas lipolytica]OFI33068.1 hypothetical protein BFC17_02010 [Alteromonas lipolytica]GGF62767.1 hypothetical protein GCM10011338_14050 [Alteromonas lipolytica]
MKNSAGRNESSRIFADYTISRLAPEIRESLTNRQLNGIREAIFATQSGSHHKVDCRFTVPLFLARYYVVFLVGRDRRKKTRLLEMRRNQSGNIQLAPLMSFLLLSLLICLLWLAVFITLYWLKRELGIDIFENFHLMDLLPRGVVDE